MTSPSASAMMRCPLLRAISFSIPVPTVTRRGVRSGTAWRCMFEPVKDRSIRFFSMNGTSAAVEPRICRCAASINVTSFASTCSGRILFLALTRSSRNVLSSFRISPASAITSFASSAASRYTSSSVTFPSFTRRYGVSINPYSFTRAYVARFSTSPMFAPSGVSTEQIRP